MDCCCEKLEIRVPGWASDNYFKGMEEISDSDDRQRRLLQCPVCSQMWLVDEYDRVTELFGMKIDNPANKTDFKFLRKHKQHLLKKYGGNSETQCQMAGCRNNAVNGFAFCAECLIQKQGVFQ